jgi:hypothetical protein
MANNHRPDLSSRDRVATTPLQAHSECAKFSYEIDDARVLAAYKKITISIDPANGQLNARPGQYINKPLTQFTGIALPSGERFSVNDLVVLKEKDESGIPYYVHGTPPELQKKMQTTPVCILDLVCTTSGAVARLGGIVTMTGNYSVSEWNVIGANAISLEVLKRYVVDAPTTDLSRYPHKCPKCTGPAYIGFNSVECSRGCK